MGAAVQWNWDAFVQTYPEFAGLGGPLAQSYWTIATSMHRNDGGGPVSNAPLQTQLLNMLTAHIAYLFGPKDQQGKPASSGTTPDGRIVGRITSASEGSVSVQVEAMAAFNTAQAQWLASTRYGALYWVATAQFRTARYRPFWDVRRATH